LNNQAFYKKGLIRTF